MITVTSFMFLLFLFSLLFFSFSLHLILSLLKLLLSPFIITSALSLINGVLAFFVVTFLSQQDRPHQGTVFRCCIHSLTSVIFFPNVLCAMSGHLRKVLFRLLSHCISHWVISSAVSWHTFGISPFVLFGCL